jgi:hypothetical protein
MQSKKMNAKPRWYLQKQGKADGPFSTDDLRDRVRQGVLLGHDLVYLEGASEWKRAFDWPELAAEIIAEERGSFTRLFTLPRAESGSDSDQEWIVLIRFEESEGLRFKQEGPYTTAAVRELLRNGKMKPSDHVWQKGFSSWVPVCRRDEFSASLWNLQDESVPLLKEVVETPAPEIPRRPVLPEPDIDDLERTASPDLPAQPPLRSVERFPKEIKKTEEGRVSKPSPPSKAPYWVTALLVVLAIGSLAVKRFATSRSNWKIEVPAPPSPQDVAAGEDSQDSSEPQRQTASAPEEISKTAANPTAVAVRSPWILQFKGDTGPALVQITGFSGQVLEVPAVNMRLDLKLTRRDSLVLDPKTLPIPEGRYVVQVFQYGKMIAKGEFASISNPEKFEVKIAAHRKQIAYYQQQEKRSLLRALDDLHAFLRTHRQQFGKELSKRSRQSLLQALESIQRPEVKKLRSVRHALIYPAGWSALAQQYEIVRGMIENSRERRPAAQQDLTSLQKKIRSARARVSQTSLWSE